MGEDKKNTWYENNSSKKMGIRSKDGLSQFHLFYFYLMYGNSSTLLDQKFQFYRYYLI